MDAKRVEADGPEPRRDDEVGAWARGEGGADRPGRMSLVQFCADCLQRRIPSWVYRMARRQNGGTAG